MTDEELNRVKAEIEEKTVARMSELSAIAAQAKRLGVDVDAVEAMKSGIQPDALRMQVLEQAAARDAATDIVAVAPAEQPHNDDDRLLNAIRKEIR